MRRVSQKAIDGAVRKLSEQISEQIDTAVQAITERMDATTTPWKAYARMMLLITGVARSAIVNTINLNPG
jgi:hypothetical protein